MNIQEIRQKYPQYNDMSDTELADSFHRKYYSDVPKEDFYSKLGVKNQPEPQEESFSDKLPRNIASGLLGLGQRGVNAPYNTAKEVQNITKPISDVFEEKLPINKYFDKNKPGYFQKVVDQFNKEHNVPEHLKNPNWGVNVENIPHLKERNFAQMLGQKGEGTLMDRLIQGGIEHAPELAGIGTLLYHAPITKYPAARSLNKVKKEIGERGVGNLNLPEHIIKDIEENKFLRNTQPNRNLLERAKQGGYEDLFDLQSDLEKVGRSHRNDMFNAANRQFGKDIGATRQELLDSMREELSNLGHEDLAQLLSKGQNQYRQYMKFKPYRNMALGAGVASLGIPGFKYIKKLMNP